MKIDKRFLATLNRCYSCNSIEVDGQTRIMLATEGEGACLAWNAPDYTQSHTVWEGPGGTMSIVPIPGTTKLHRIEENIAAVELALTDDELDALTNAQIEGRGERYSEANQQMIDR